MTLDTLARQCEDAYKKNPALWFDETGQCVFDFPEYGGLTEETSSVLSSDCVDCIQGFLSWITPREFNKEELLSALKQHKRDGWAIPT